MQLLAKLGLILVSVARIWELDQRRRRSACCWAVTKSQNVSRFPRGEYCFKDNLHTLSINQQGSAFIARVAVRVYALIRFLFVWSDNWPALSEKSVFEHAQNVRIQIILRLRKVSFGHCLSIDSFEWLIQWRPKIDYAHAQADKGIRCPHIHKDVFAWRFPINAISI